jgi:hypothetical protein
VLDSAAEVLCAAGTSQDLRALQAFVRKRLESFPKQERYIGFFADKKQSELCPKLGADEAKRAEPPLLFGD